MRAKIIVKVDGVYLDDFWYQGESGGRAISRAIWREMGLYNLDHEKTSYSVATATGEPISDEVMIEPRDRLLDSETK